MLRYPVHTIPAKEWESLQCKNSLNGEHEWHLNTGKNKKTQQVCVLCSQLYADTVIKK